ncbi:O-antigen ligase domain-containing protein [Odoribacter sp. OF09-27XD]|jgi:O-antigen ligase|nr:O-antigen ligase domain-containing protein [Odoribacter sp. OF09-27XD]
MFSFPYTTTVDRILLFLLIGYIFFVGILGSIGTYLLLSVSCLFLFNGYKTNSCYTWHFFPFRYCCYIILFLILHFLLVPFKSPSFLLGTLTTFLIAIALIQKVEYEVIERWIIIFGCVQLFFGLWYLLSFSSLVAIFQYFLPENVLIAMWKWHAEGRNTGINSQTFPLAFYLVQLLGVFFIKYRCRINLLFVFLSLVILFVLFTTSRRGALIFSFAGVFFCWVIVKKYSFFKLLTIGTAALLSIFIFIKGFGVLGLDFPVLDRFDVSAVSLTDYDSINELSSSRLSLIVHAYNFFSERPLLGQGFKFFFETKGQDVHNTYLQLLCESGIIGTCMLLSFFLYNLTKTVSMIKRYVRVPKDIVYSFYGQFFFLIMCFIENPFSDRYFFLSYMIAISLMYSRLLKEKLGLSV